MLGIGDSGTTVEPIGIGTYTTSDRLVAYGLMGDGTLTCPAAMATGGTVTLTSIGKGGIKGTYDVTIDGVNYAGSLDAPLCWQGVVSCS